MDNHTLAQGDDIIEKPVKLYVAYRRTFIPRAPHVTVGRPSLR
jgi:hypothetical protein